MAFIYIDESGDLGMNCKESSHFIITAVKINDEKTNVDLWRIPKKIRQRTLKKKEKGTAELKFSNSSVLIREIYLKKAAQLDIEIYALIINKKHTKQNLRDNLPILYNYLIMIVLEKALLTVDFSKNLTIYLDRSMSAQQRENFETYIKTKFLHLFKDLPYVKILHENSQNNNGLQVTDYICGAFGYKYNTAKLKEDCDMYVNIIHQQIKIEKSNLFQNKE